MTRTYQPTGKPPGRPPTKAKRATSPDRRKVKAIRDAINLFTKLKVDLTPEEKEALERSAGNIVPAQGEKWADTLVPAHAMVPLEKLVPLSEEQLKEASAQARGILGAVVAGFHDKVPGLLNTLAAREPEKALKLYIELMEYQAPKLARVEQAGSVDHRHQVFVALEPRDQDPRTVIEASVVHTSSTPAVDSGTEHS